MKISSEFSKYAQDYEYHNIIQEKVAQKVLSFVHNEPKNILDLGCGRGALVEKISWQYEHFVGVDFSKGMLALHPKSNKIECIYSDFNDIKLFKYLQHYTFDYILSASALQWAKDLESLFENIAKLGTPFSLAIFTSNTFKTLHETAGIRSPLRDQKTLYTLQEKYLNADFEVKNYSLQFETVQDMFRYIKKSGVSGSRNILSFKEMKHLMQSYPLDVLEFEVVFIHSR
jgi:malonyl-CoA O-methyltransferase